MAVEEGNTSGCSLEGVHPESQVHAWAVGQEGSQGCLFKQAEDEDLVPRWDTQRAKGVTINTHTHSLASRQDVVYQKCLTTLVQES